MKPTRVARLLLVIALVCGAVACGDDDPSDSPSTTQPSKAATTQPQNIGTATTLSPRGTPSTQGTTGSTAAPSTTAPNAK